MPIIRSQSFEEHVWEKKMSPAFPRKEYNLTYCLGIILIYAGQMLHILEMILGVIGMTNLLIFLQMQILSYRCGIIMGLKFLDQEYMKLQFQCIWQK